MLGGINEHTCDLQTLFFSLIRPFKYFSVYDPVRWERNCGVDKQRLHGSHADQPWPGRDYKYRDIKQHQQDTCFVCVNLFYSVDDYLTGMAGLLLHSALSLFSCQGETCCKLMFFKIA